MHIFFFMNDQDFEDGNWIGELQYCLVLDQGGQETPPVWLPVSWARLLPILESFRLYAVSTTGHLRTDDKV